MVTCVGYANGKYQIEESEPGLLLNFIGPDAEKFEQQNTPKEPTKSVDFRLTIVYLRTQFPGFLPRISE